jgi:diaminopimelate decarboxylase
MNPATMTPEQLAEHGIPVVVALRARLEEAVRRYSAARPESSVKASWAIRVQERRDALAIFEAKEDC